MGLKQNIVIVNEYTIKNDGKKGGSRGGTPGDYVLRYMARGDAVETISPVKKYDFDDYVIRYMAREDAVERVDSNPELRYELKHVDGLGGIAFDNTDISMSDESVKRKAKAIQKSFDEGKTCLKTVFSFKEEYLKAWNVIPEDVSCENPGDFKGFVDQTKLRKAIMSGMTAMSRGYDDLQWVGTIQVDTKNVHCHICAVDMGEGNITPDGTQKGKISDRSKRLFRRGVDRELGGQKQIAFMASNVQSDKKNTLAHVKRFTNGIVNDRGNVQFILTCLPGNKKLWRAGSNAKEMKKANLLVRTYVETLIADENSGYKQAVESVESYAMTRYNDEGLSKSEYSDLIHKGKERIIHDCMNGVYSVLKSINDDDKVTNTPILDVMSADYEKLMHRVDDSKVVEFGYKLRSYSKRLDFHKNNFERHTEDIKSYHENNPSEDSKPLLLFLENEQNYESKLMSKYRTFLNFRIGDSDEFQDSLKDVVQYDINVNNLERMSNDRSIKNMNPVDAEKYGKYIYNQHGGHYLKNHKHIITDRLAAMKDTYSKKLTDLKNKLSIKGMSLNKDLKIINEEPYQFDDVKALDVHHMGYDFTTAVPVSDRNIVKFANEANVRKDLLLEASGYLQDTNQSEIISRLPLDDIFLMNKIADDLVKTRSLESLVQPKYGIDKKNTISIDNDCNDVVKMTVQNIIQSVRFDANYYANLHNMHTEDDNFDEFN